MRVFAHLPLFLIAFLVYSECTRLRRRSKQRKRALTHDNENTACLEGECPPSDISSITSNVSLSMNTTNIKSEAASNRENSKIKASNIAQKAAQEAKAASDAQAVAGAQAAHQVKEQLAEKAAEAARAAEAALAGKEAVVAQLEQEVHEAEEVVQEESASLQATTATVANAIQAAQESQQLLKVLQQAVQLAQATAQNAEASSAGIQAEHNNKQQLLEVAKTRVEQLMKQLSAARSDLKSTKNNAMQAENAAKEAKMNVGRNRRMMEQEQQQRG